jgi:hypothetical protein
MGYKTGKGSSLSSLGNLDTVNKRPAASYRSELLL